MSADPAARRFARTMDLYKQPRLSRDVRTALLYMARLSAAPELGVDYRVAVALSRDILLDLRLSEPRCGVLGYGTDVAQTAQRMLRCLQRDARCDGQTAWRSRVALDLLRSAGAPWPS